MNAVVPVSDRATRLAVVPSTTTTAFELGAKLHEARKLRGLGQLDLALQLGISQRHLRRIEQGRSQPSVPIVRSWLRVCEVRLRLELVVVSDAGSAHEK